MVPFTFVTSPSNTLPLVPSTPDTLPPCQTSSIPSMLQPQGLCTGCWLCLKALPSYSSLAHSSPSFRICSKSFSQLGRPCQPYLKLQLTPALLLLSCIFYFTHNDKHYLFCKWIYSLFLIFSLHYTISSLWVRILILLTVISQTPETVLVHRRCLVIFVE